MFLKNEIGWKLAYLGTSCAVYLLDQTTKAWAARRLRFGESVEAIPNLLNFTYAENPGIAFSQFQNGGEAGRWALAALAGFAAILVLYFFWRTPKSQDRILGAFALALAGILGNLTDRVRLGYVIDFIDVQFGNWHYPTFNIADSAICVGAALLILDMFFRKKDDQLNAEDE